MTVFTAVVRPCKYVLFCAVLAICASSSQAASGAPVFLTTNLNATGTVGVPFSVTVLISGTETITLSVVNPSATNKLPSGLSFSTSTTAGTTHVLSGVPSMAGTFSGTVTAKNSVGTATLPFTIVINAPATTATSGTITIVDSIKDTVKTSKVDGESSTDQFQSGTVAISAIVMLSASDISQVNDDSIVMISIGDFSFNSTIGAATKKVSGKRALFVQSDVNDLGKTVITGAVSLKFDAKKGLQLKIGSRTSDSLSSVQTVLAGEFEGVASAAISQSVNCYIQIGSVIAYFPVTLTGKSVVVNKNVGSGDNADQFQLTTATLKGAVKLK